MHGTTGYEFASIVNNLFVDSRHERAFSDIYARFLRAPRRSLSFDDLVYQSKKAVMHETMSGDINSLGHQLNRFSEQNRHFRDFTLYSLISTLKEVIACFPVYRTYLTEGGPVTEHDRRYVGRAIACAKRTQGTAPIVCDFVEQLLLGNASPSRTPDQGDEQVRFVGKFQQITSPVAAKGHRRHGALHLQPSPVVERSGLATRNDSASTRPPCTRDGRAAARVAARAVGHVDPRHQARRRRARAPQRAV